MPTPIDHHRIPDLGLLRGACELAVAHARAGQTLILTSTSYVGTTRDLLIEPLRERGFIPGDDIFVAFSPERIDPGNSTHPQHRCRASSGAPTPSRPGAPTGARADRTDRARGQLGRERRMTKLYENTFRAVNIAFALEMSQAATALGLSIIEVIDAAATKPYGFMPFYPGPGVGGHCIPCDPHYLLWQLREQRLELPTVERAMATIAARPRVVAHRLRDLLADQGRADPRRQGAARRRVLQARGSKTPANPRRSNWCATSVRSGPFVSLWDPIAQRLDLEDGRVLHTIDDPQRVPARRRGGAYRAPEPRSQPGYTPPRFVLDASYRLDLPSPTEQSSDPATTEYGVTPGDR